MKYQFKMTIPRKNNVVGNSYEARNTAIENNRIALPFNLHPSQPITKNN
jgi:hypothetical protein